MFRRRTVRALALLAVVPSTALAQVRSDTTSPPLSRANDSTRVSLMPALPRQGSIIRIQLHVSPWSAARHDTVALARPRSDTLPGGAAWTIPRRDSLTPDSLARLRADSIPVSRTDSSALPPVVSDSLRGRVTAIRGTLFGEPLHFAAADSGSYIAIGGIPVDAPRSARVALVVERFGVPPDTMQLRLDIARTPYKMEKMEKLTVAPRFGQAPDSALTARIAREQALAAAVSRGSHDAPALWTETFTRPRPSRVTSGFGDGREFNGKVQSRHMGLDLAGVVGAPVLAAGRGVVALVGEFYYAGNAVYIDHGAGLVTAYFHLSAVNVAKGDTVSAGDTIGKVGATGRVTGPHLHWVARYGAVTIDPSTLLDLAPARREP